MKRLEPQQMLGLRVMGKKGLDAYRSCSMDFGGITPLYVYRMWSESVPLEEIESAMAELKFPGR